MRQLKKKMNLLVLLLTTLSLSFCTAEDEATSTTTATATPEGPFFLWASGYEKLSAETSGAWVKTWDDGLVYAGSEGGWTYANFERSTQADIDKNNNFGRLYTHASALTSSSDRIYIAVKGPDGSKYNLSSTNTLVLTTGQASRSASSGYSAAPADSHAVFTVSVKGGSQDSSFNWSNDCSKDLDVSAANGNFRTYTIALADLTCSSGTLEALLLEVAEVVVSVEHGKNTSAEAASGDSTNTMPVVGWMGFYDNSASPSSTETSDQVLFASGYAANADNNILADTTQGGTVRSGSGGDFAYGGYAIGSDSDMATRQSTGIQWKKNSGSPTMDGNDYIYQSVNAPNNGSVNISKATNLAIQLGNSTDNSKYKVFTLELNGGTYSSSWPYTCSVDFTLPDNSLTPTNVSFGMMSHKIALSTFTCSSGSLDELKADLQQVVVKVVGGKTGNTGDAEAGEEYFLPSIGWIGFNSGD